jgi:hypothetical protein
MARLFARLGKEQNYDWEPVGPATYGDCNGNPPIRLFEQLLRY